MNLTDPTSFTKDPGSETMPARSSGPPLDFSRFVPSANASLFTQESPSTQPSLEQRVKEIEEKLSSVLTKFSLLQERLSKAEALAEKTNNDLLSLGAFVNAEPLIRQYEMRDLLLRLDEKMQIVDALTKETESLDTTLDRSFYTAEECCKRLQKKLNENRDEHAWAMTTLEVIEKVNREETKNPAAPETVTELAKKIQALREQNKQFSQFMHTYSKTLEDLQAHTIAI